jgi:hypothetical protein
MILLDFIKEIVHYNTKIRYLDTPDSIYEYTIYSKNFDSIVNCIYKISDINQFSNPILKPVFSKGISRLFGLFQLIKDISFYNSHTENYKMFMIAQYIILNQIFGDGNHRTSKYVLKNYSTYSNEEIQFIMNFTERIHSWKGDLHNAKLWVCKEDLLYPNIDRLVADKQINFLFS